MSFHTPVRGSGVEDRTGSSPTADRPGRADEEALRSADPIAEGRQGHPHDGAELTCAEKDQDLCAGDGLESTAQALHLSVRATRWLPGDPLSQPSGSPHR